MTTVLVVDDDADTRYAVADIVLSEGAEVVSVEDGASALAYLRAADALPSLIMLDLKMPNIDGWQFRDEQKNDRRLRDIPVVIMTGGESAPRDLPIIHKPLGLAQVLSVVRAYLS